MLIPYIPKGETEIKYTEFAGLREGDTVFQNGEMVRVASDAHFSGDASYDGYLFYDAYTQSVFEDEVDTEAPEPTKVYVVHKTHGGFGIYIDCPNALGTSREGQTFSEGTEFEVALDLFLHSWGLQARLVSVTHENEWGDGEKPVILATKSKEPVNIWMRGGITLHATMEEATQICTMGNGIAKTVIAKILDEGRWEFDGEAYIPQISVADINRKHNTNFDECEIDITF